MSNNTKEVQELIEKLSSELAHNLFDTIKTLQFAIDLTERYYENSHSRFVADMSEKVATSMGVGEEDASQIRIAGLLHDIGKIGFRDTALFKTLPEMNLREAKQYRLHVDIGREMLSYHKSLKNVSDIVYEHHENFDGTGFPEKKSRSKINVGARIISVVDYYHNIMHKSFNSSDIPDVAERGNAIDYLNETQRKFDNTINSIDNLKNIKFDPEIAELFIKLIESERKRIEGFLVKKIHVSNIKIGMIFGESYYNRSGLLVANKGETVTNESLKALLKIADSNQIPHKLLMLSEKLI